MDEMVLLRGYLYGGALQELKSQNITPRYSFGVHLTAVRNLYLAEHGIEPEMRAYAREFFAEHLGPLPDDWLENREPSKTTCQDWIDLSAFAHPLVAGVKKDVRGLAQGALAPRLQAGIQRLGCPADLGR